MIKLLSDGIRDSCSKELEGMLSANGKFLVLAIEALEIGGVSGAAALIAAGQLLQAFLYAMVFGLCVIILVVATAIGEAIKVKINQFINHRFGNSQ